MCITDLWNIFNCLSKCLLSPKGDSPYMSKDLPMLIWYSLQSNKKTQTLAAQSLTYSLSYICLHHLQDKEKRCILLKIQMVTTKDNGKMVDMQILHSLSLAPLLTVPSVTQASPCLHNTLATYTSLHAPSIVTWSQWHHIQRKDSHKKPPLI